MNFAERWVWIAWVLCSLCFAGAAYLILFETPAAERFGFMVSMLFVHIPSAWMSLFCYSSMALASFVSLIWRHPLADIVTMAIAPIGAVFTALTLLTGSLWGKEAWGAWWVWSDPRMTSTFVLLLQFLGYMLLVRAFTASARGRRIGAYVVLAGIANVFFVKWGIEWFESLHQSASVNLEGSAIDATYIRQLLLMVAGCQLLFVALVVDRMRLELDSLRLHQFRARFRRQELAKSFLVNGEK